MDLWYVLYGSTKKNSYYFPIRHVLIGIITAINCLLPATKKSLNIIHVNLRSYVGLSLRWPGFGPRLVDVRFVVDKVAMEQGFP